MDRRDSERIRRVQGPLDPPSSKQRLRNGVEDILATSALLLWKLPTLTPATARRSGHSDSRTSLPDALTGHTRHILNLPVSFFPHLMRGRSDVNINSSIAPQINQYKIDESIRKSIESSGVKLSSRYKTCSGSHEMRHAFHHNTSRVNFTLYGPRFREFSQIGNVDVGVNVDVESHPVGSSTQQNFQFKSKE